MVRVLKNWKENEGMTNCLRLWGENLSDETKHADGKIEWQIVRWKEELESYKVKIRREKLSHKKSKASSGLQTTGSVNHAHFFSAH